MDKKTLPTHMLPTTDPPQDKRLTQTENEGLETNFPSKRTGKNSRGGNTYIRQNRPQKNGHKEKREGHFIILKGRIHQEDINIVNIYAPNIGAPKYIKKILEDSKKDIDSNTIIVGDFNTPLSKMDRSSKQNINKDIVSLNRHPNWKGGNETVTVCRRHDSVHGKPYRLHQKTTRPNK